MPRKPKPPVEERPAIINQSVEVVPMSRLKKHPQNVNEGDAGAIYESIEANGFYGLVVAQKSTGHILAGNHRYDAAEMHGMGEIPVVWLDVDDDRALRIMLADNRTTRLGHDDETALAELLAGLKNTTDSLDGTGFDEDFLDDLIEDLSRQGITVEAAKDYDSFEQTQHIVKGKEKPTFGVLVVCEGEPDQAEMYLRLRDEGYEVVKQGSKPPGVKR
jgi:hypothetical protein